MSDRLLALDLGTTSTRALVIDPDGHVLGRAQQSVGVHFPSPGRVEQDPDELWSASLAVLEAALEDASVPAREVAALGIANQRATVLAWSAATGEALTTAIGWQDQRTVERVAGFRAAGIPLNTLASATKFEWWMKNEPAVQTAAASGDLRLGTPDTWLCHRLSGESAHVTDPSNASSTALFDAAAGTWAEPLCELFSVPMEALPEIVATDAVVGETPVRLLGAAIPVAARAGDQQASAFALGLREAGDAKLTLGTSGTLDVHTGDTPAELTDGVYPLALWSLVSGERAFCQEGQVVTAGAAVEWLVSLGLFENAADVDAAARAAETGGVICVPAFQGLGAPHADEGATGWIGGLTRGSGRGAIARALLEGIAQRCADLVEALAVHRALRVDGGLARSDLLLQTLADASGVPVERAEELETTGLGAARLAASGVGLAVADKRVAIEHVFVPEVSPDARAAARARWAAAIDCARGTQP